VTRAGGGVTVSAVAVAGPPDNLASERRVATAASLGRRLVAAAVDGAVDFALVPLMIMLQRRSGFVAATAVALTVMALIAIVIVNEFVLVARTGQSVGKRLLGIRVVDSSTMAPPRVGQIIWRNLVKGGVSGFGWHPFGGATSFTIGAWPVICFAPAIFDTKWHRGLHDRLAHTVVIDVRGERGRDA
jgi:uncharacterized RDD family membrane protein YckC